jgi:hypothetical protein
MDLKTAIDGLVQTGSIGEAQWSRFNAIKAEAVAAVLDFFGIDSGFQDLLLPDQDGYGGFFGYEYSRNELIRDAIGTPVLDAAGKEQTLLDEQNNPVIRKTVITVKLTKGSDGWYAFVTTDRSTGFVKFRPSDTNPQANFLRLKSLTV